MKILVMRVINVAITHFFEYNPDAYIVANNASCQSAFNRVERSMASLSRELAGLILSHEHFGRHMDNDGKNTDGKLVKCGQI